MSCVEVRCTQLCSTGLWVVALGQGQRTLLIHRARRSRCMGRPHAAAHAPHTKHTAMLIRLNSGRRYGALWASAHAPTCSRNRRMRAAAGCFRMVSIAPLRPTAHAFRTRSSKGASALSNNLMASMTDTWGQQGPQGGRGRPCTRTHTWHDEARRVRHPALLPHTHTPSHCRRCPLPRPARPGWLWSAARRRLPRTYAAHPS